MSSSSVRTNLCSPACMSLSMCTIARISACAGTILILCPHGDLSVEYFQEQQTRIFPKHTHHADLWFGLGLRGVATLTRSRHKSKIDGSSWKLVYRSSWNIMEHLHSSFHFQLPWKTLVVVRRHANKMSTDLGRFTVSQEYFPSGVGISGGA